jgi:hypothetical protein
MKVELTVTKEFEVKYLQAQCGVRYWEDGDEDIPCREGDNWNPLIEIETGKILNWEQGKTASLHYKVCDAGFYSLLDGDKKEITSYDGYVPKILCPKDSGYGNYVIMDIDENGMIQNYSTTDLEEFLGLED